MNQQTTTTHPQREFRAVELLTGGEHVNHQVHQDGDVVTWQVGHVTPYTDTNSIPMVAVTVTPLGGGEPELIRERRGVTLPLATDAEIDMAAAEGRRVTFANALVELSRRIMNDRLPVPGFFNVSGVADSREQLDTWAKAFDAEVKMVNRYPVISWKLGGLDMRLQGEQEPETEQEQDWYFTFVPSAGSHWAISYVVIHGTHEQARQRAIRHFGDGGWVQHRDAEAAGVERRGLVLVPESEWSRWQTAQSFAAEQAPAADTEPEHHHVGGSGGAPGECSAECACGVTFDGFDTIAEAVAQLDVHIAEPQPVDAPTTQAGE